MKLVSVLILALFLVACDAGQSVTGPQAVATLGTGRASLLGAPPASDDAGPGAGTGPQTPDNRYTCAATSQVNPNQNNGKVDLWLNDPLPSSAVLTRWVITDRRNGQMVASGITEPNDTFKGRLFVFYPKNGGSYQAEATTLHAGNCAGKPYVVPFGFNKAQDNPVAKQK